MGQLPYLLALVVPGGLYNHIRFSAYSMVILLIIKNFVANKALKLSTEFGYFQNTAPVKNSQNNK